MYNQKSGCIIYMGSVHSKEASLLKALYVTAKHGLIGLVRVVAKEGASEQAKARGISENEVVRNVMLKEMVDGEFTTVEDIAETALFLASFGSNALTGSSNRRGGFTPDHMSFP